MSIVYSLKFLCVTLSTLLRLHRPYTWKIIINIITFVLTMNNQSKETFKKMPKKKKKKKIKNLIYISYQYLIDL